MTRKTYQEWVNTYSEIDFDKHEPTFIDDSIYLTTINYLVDGVKYRILKSKSGGDDHTIQLLETKRF